MRLLLKKLHAPFISTPDEKKAEESFTFVKAIDGASEGKVFMSVHQ